MPSLKANISVSVNLELEKIEKSSEHKEVTYTLFKRRLEDFRISSSRQLDFKEHCLFVENHPYHKWFLIKFQRDYIGTVYLSNDNSVGIFLAKNQCFRLPEIINIVLSQFKPLPAIPSVRQGFFVMNISPENAKYENILTELCLPLIQKTYQLRKKE